MAPGLMVDSSPLEVSSRSCFPVVIPIDGTGLPPGAVAAPTTQVRVSAGLQAGAAIGPPAAQPRVSAGLQGTPSSPPVPPGVPASARGRGTTMGGLKYG